MDVMFMAETWHDSKSISIYKLLKLITGVKEYDHITLVFDELHCLKIDWRNELGTALQIYNSFSNKDPTYLRRELVPAARQPYKLVLRVAKFENFILNKHKPESLGFKKFSISKLLLWKNLFKSFKFSSSIKSNYLSLNTYLFNEFSPSS